MISAFLKFSFVIFLKKQKRRNKITAPGHINDLQSIRPPLKSRGYAKEQPFLSA
jgi:hypothetical protein